MLPISAIEKARNTLSRLLCGLVALLVLNSSIDTPVASDVMKWQNGKYTEDLAYNDIESFYELITEDILDLEDFVPEHDNDADDTEKQSKAPQFFTELHTLLPQPPVFITEARTYPEKVVGLLHQPTSQHTPPPDIAA